MRALARSRLPINDRYSEQQLFAQYQKGRLVLSAEWRVTPVYTAMGNAPATYSPLRTSYAMASYRITSKLTLGTYYDSYLGFFDQNRLRDDPENYMHDVAVNGRVDANRYLYFKVEGHFIRGNGQGFYAQNNPNGLETNTRLLLARVGFTF